MSRFLDFVKTMVPRFGRDRVVEDLDMTKGSLEQNAILSWQAFAEYVRGAGFTSTAGKDFERLVKVTFKDAGNAGAADVVADRLSRLPLVAATVIKIVNKEFERDMLSEGLTLDKVYVVRLTTALSFIDTAALRVLNYLSVVEAGKDPVKELSRAGAKESIDEMADFISKLEALTRLKPSELESFIRQLPEVVVSETAEQALASLGDNRLDPTGLFKGQANGFVGSPFHGIGMRIAQGQVERYKRNQELRKILSMRLLDMKSKGNTDNDPSLERNIQITQSRIDVLDEKIRTFEEKTL